ncbi:hypothetical protein EJ08DRAFT_57750 [Tothia fuscella]|uniref:Uncharacterized protein n=1 Tax=Tothia fuscella TaxID=1048955 RepID=A0A9P4NYC0_9PEZI|nr:hypothetical protein EJ08DRAFT_57750 [Tothia fuscella]
MHQTSDVPGKISLRRESRAPVLSQREFFIQSERVPSSTTSAQHVWNSIFLGWSLGGRRVLLSTFTKIMSVLRNGAGMAMLICIFVTRTIYYATVSPPLLLVRACCGELR